MKRVRSKAAVRARAEAQEAQTHARLRKRAARRKIAHHVPVKRSAEKRSPEKRSPEKLSDEEWIEGRIVPVFYRGLQIGIRRKDNTRRMMAVLWRHGRARKGQADAADNGSVRR